MPQGVYQRTEEMKRRMSISHKGRCLSREHRLAIGESLKGRPCSNETRVKLSESHKGEKNPWYGKKLSEEHQRKMSEAHHRNPLYYGRKASLEARRNMSQSQKEHWANLGKDEREKRLNNFTRAGHKAGLKGHGINKVEGQLLELINKNRLPFKYVGNGEVWFGNRNPDFINTNGKKQVIEVFGTYWHPVFDVAQRTEHYRQYGLDSLVIWEDELSNPAKVARKLTKFAGAR